MRPPQGGTATSAPSARAATAPAPASAAPATTPESSAQVDAGSPPPPPPSAALTPAETESTAGGGLPAQVGSARRAPLCLSLAVTCSAGWRGVGVYVWDVDDTHGARVCRCQWLAVSPTPHSDGLAVWRGASNTGWSPDPACVACRACQR